MWLKQNIIYAKGANILTIDAGKKGLIHWD
jgi:hypothetical protein